MRSEDVSHNPEPGDVPEWIRDKYEEDGPVAISQQRLAEELGVSELEMADAISDDDINAIIDAIPQGANQEDIDAAVARAFGLLRKKESQELRGA